MVLPEPLVGRWECDLETERLTWSAEVYRIFGLPAGVSPDRAATLQLYHDDSRMRLEELRGAAIRAGGCFTLDAQIRPLQGGTRWVRIIADVDRRAGVRPRLHGVKQDITAERFGWARLRSLADHDPVTGVLGPDAFHNMLHAPAPGPRAVAGLLLLDVRGAPPFPDDAVRDACLRELALRLSRAFPAAAMIARPGIDRFAVLLRLPVAEPALEDALHRATMSLRRPLPWRTGWIGADVRIGAAIRGPDGKPDSYAMLDQAERALDMARTANVGAVRIFGLSSHDPLRPADGPDGGQFIL